MKLISSSIALLLGGLLAGCSATMPTMPVDNCCTGEQVYVAPPPDCARRLMNIRQVDSCQRCNDFTVSVRATGACIGN